MSLQNHFESRAWRVWCGLLLAVSLFTTASRWQCEGVDEVEYLALAHSLNTGLGYTQYGTPHVLYPPLFPLLVSPLMSGPEFPWKSVYLANAFLGWSALVFAGAWMRRGGGMSGRIASWFLVSSYYGWSFSTRFLMPEPLFLLLVVLTLAFCGRQMREKHSPGLCLTLTFVLALLAAATKTAAIALGGALLMSGVIRARGTRNWRHVLPGLVAMAAIAGFLLAWEVRAARVAPAARESYGRWILHLTGIARETDGMIARGKGEDRELRRLSLPGRMHEMAGRTGQYIASFPRPPWNFQPLALMLAGSVLYGTALRLRRAPHDPISWYGIASMAMFVMTHWTSSYLRYLYVVSPWLYAALAEALPHAALANRAGNPVIRLFILGFCGWGLGLTVFLPDHHAELQGSARVFELLTGSFCGTIYAAGFLLALRPPSAAIREFWIPAGLAATCMIWLFLTVLGSALILQRHRLVVSGEVLRARNLTGMVRAGEEVRKRARPETRIVSSMPAFASLVAGRMAIPPEYVADRLAARPGDLILTPGNFNDFYAYRLRDICGLRDEIHRLFNEGRLERIFSMDGSEVYQVR